jgi:hypothetical protein
MLADAGCPDRVGRREYEDPDNQNTLGFEVWPQGAAPSPRRDEPGPSTAKLDAVPFDEQPPYPRLASDAYAASSSPPS